MLTLTPEHERNVYSQSGEDGVIEAICAALGIAKGAAVEFGAWDGVHLSNTARLREAGWDVCLIEGHPKRYSALLDKFRDNPNVVPVKGWVAASGPMSLDALLARHFNRPVDLLSIDIDGDDYHILASLSARPRIVVVEYNPTIPPTIARTNPPGSSKGTSLAAFAELARERGYDLVHATESNVVLVDASRNTGIRPKTAFEAFIWSNAAFVISDFDGGNWLARGADPRGPVFNPWSGATAARPLGPPVSTRLRRLKHRMRGLFRAE